MGRQNKSHYYIEALVQHLKNSGFEQSYMDSCLLSRLIDNVIIFAAISVDDFLVVATTVSLVEKFAILILLKYTMKRLGHRTDSWSVVYHMLWTAPSR